MSKRTSGFSVLELMVVVIIAGIMMAVAIPILRNSSPKTAVRGAGDEIARLFATGRATSIQRGRTAWLVLDPSANTVMVTAMKVGASGIDTIARPDNLKSRYSVTFTASNTSLAFTPRGIGASLTMTTVVISSMTGGVVDTVLIYPTGKIVR